MNIKELAIEYEYVAILWNSSNEFLELVKQATSQIDFSTCDGPNTYPQTKKDILRYHKHTGKSFALICTCGDKFQFFSRDYSEYERYSDWYDYKIIYFAKYQRKEKIKRLNEKFSYR